MRMTLALIVLAAAPAFSQVTEELLLHGRVIDRETAEALADARVLLYANEGYLSDDLIARRKPFADLATDADGRFEYRGTVPPRALEVDVFVFHGDFIDYASGPKYGAPVRGEKTLPDIALVRGLLVEGVVLLPSGEPAAEGNIEIRVPLRLRTTEQAPVINAMPRGAPIDRWAGIGAGGRFRFRAVPYTWELRIRVPGHIMLREEIVVTAAPMEPHTFRVAKGHSLRGRVVGADVKGIEGAKIFDGKLRVAAWSDASGAFAMHGVPAVPPALRVEHAEYIGANPPLEQAGEEWLLRLAPARWLYVEFQGCDGGAVEERTLLLDLGDGKQVHFRREASGIRFRSDAFDPTSERGTVALRDFVDASFSWPCGAGAHDLGVVVVERGNTISVTVRDAKEAPVEGAFLSIEPEKGDVLRRAISGVRTDRDGSATLAGMPAGTYWLVARKTGYRKDSRLVEIDEAAKLNLSVTLIRGAAITLRLVSGNGAAVPAVRGHIAERYRIEGMTYQDGASDKDGLLRIENVRTGEPVTLKLVSEAHVPQTIEIPALADEEVRDLGDVAMNSGGTIRGVFTDEVGAPIEGVAVGLHYEGGAGKRDAATLRVERPRVRTGADGAFEFAGLPPGIYSVRAHSRGYENPANSAGYSSGFAERVKLAENEVLQLALTLRRTNVHTGVIAFRGGKPIENASVLAVSKKDATISFSGSSDKNGRFGLPQLPDGPLTLQVRHNRHDRTLALASPAEIPDEILFDYGADLIVRLELPEGESEPRYVSMILNDESPSARRRASFGYAQVVDGVARFEDLPPGQHSVYLTEKGTERTAPRVIELAEGATAEITWAFELIRAPTRTIAVTVVDSGGAPVAGATVTLYGAGEPRKTGSDGRAVFTFREESHGLSIEADGYVSSRLHQPNWTEAPETRVALEREAVLALTLLHEDGVPASGWFVAARNGDAMASGETDEKGCVRLSKLAAGENHVYFRDPGGPHSSARFDLVEGQAVEITHKLPPALSIAGFVTLNGIALSGGRLEFRRRGAEPSDWTHLEIDPDGAYRVQLYAPGDYRVTYSAPPGAGASRQRFRICAIGASGSVDIAFVSFRCTVQVTDESGAPLPGVAVQLKGGIGGHDEVRTRNDGRFRFDDVAPGYYVLTAGEGADLPRQFASRVVSVEGDTEVELRAVAAGRATLRFATSAPEACTIQDLCCHKHIVGTPSELSAELTLELAQGRHRLLVHRHEREEISSGMGELVGQSRVFFAYVEVDTANDAPALVELRAGRGALLSLRNEKDEPEPPGIPVSITSLDTGGAAIPWGTLETGVRGSISLDLAPGRYRVAATLASGAGVTRDIELPDNRKTHHFQIGPE